MEPQKLVQAVKKLKDNGHPAYKNIQIDENFHLREPDAPQDLKEAEEQSDTAGSQTDKAKDDKSKPSKLSSVQEHTFDYKGNTSMSANAPEVAMKVNTTKEAINVKPNRQKTSSVSIAPGENKIPSSFLRNKSWDVNAFPCLHPSGRFGLAHEREQKLSTQVSDHIWYTFGITVKTAFQGMICIKTINARLKAVFI